MFHLYVRMCPNSPWQMVGWTPNRSDAELSATQYRMQGYDAFVR